MYAPTIFAISEGTAGSSSHIARTVAATLRHERRHMQDEPKKET
jgi:hypothetical protein